MEFIYRWISWGSKKALIVMLVIFFGAMGYYYLVDGLNNNDFVQNKPKNYKYLESVDIDKLIEKNKFILQREYSTDYIKKRVNTYEIKKDLEGICTTIFYTKGKATVCHYGKVSDRDNKTLLIFRGVELDKEDKLNKELEQYKSKLYDLYKLTKLNDSNSDSEIQNKMKKVKEYGKEWNLMNKILGARYEIKQIKKNY